MTLARRALVVPVPGAAALFGSRQARATAPQPTPACAPCAWLNAPLGCRPPPYAPAPAYREAPLHGLTEKCLYKGLRASTRADREMPSTRACREVPLQRPPGACAAPAESTLLLSKYVCLPACVPHAHAPSHFTPAEQELESQQAAVHSRHSSASAHVLWPGSPSPRRMVRVHGAACLHLKLRSAANGLAASPTSALL